MAGHIDDDSRAIGLEITVDSQETENLVMAIEEVEFVDSVITNDALKGTKGFAQSPLIHKIKISSQADKSLPTFFNNCQDFFSGIRMIFQSIIFRFVHLSRWLIIVKPYSGFSFQLLFQCFFVI